MDAPQPGIQERLFCIEKELLRAAAEGATALTTFDKRWSGLLDDVEFAVRTKTISDETLAVANIVTSRVEVLLECLLDFHTSADTRGYGLEPIFARLSMDDTVDEPSAQPPFYIPHQACTSSSLLSCPPYIEPAYRWLVANLHDPYPSVEVKDEIALKTSSYRKVIDAWFVDARKRIGWNKLRKERFSNKRSNIVDAATSFFIQEDAKQLPDLNLALEFVAIEKRAKDLYSDKFSESVLAAKLDVALKDLTPEMKAHAKAAEKRRRQEKQSKGRSAQAASASYPSPSHSSSATPQSPAPSPLSGEDEISLNTGSKRRTLSPEPSDDHGIDRPHKRSRMESPSHMAATSLPSPALSFNGSLQTSDNSQLPPLSSTTLPISSTGRKRRLSDADGQSAPKRPRNLYLEPRMHVVSDPLPMTSTLSSWFENNFSIPSAVTIEEPESSLPLEVELYDYSTSSYIQPNSPEASRNFAGLSNHTPSPRLQSVTTSIEAPPVVPEVQSYALDISATGFNYDELCWEPESLVADFADIINEGDGSSAPTFNLSSELHFPSNFFDSFSTSFMTSMSDTAVADFSVPFSCDPASNDWTLPPMLLSQDTFGLLPDLDFSQSHSLILNPSIAGADASSDSVSQMLVQADKAAKQRKLIAMKEDMRRLELEIIAS